ncbi:DeoR/GlpR family DNA-binding transcription regulator [Gleimia hominis]|uniref:DeoR/GlpR family DNA-binding transcription regulator n=1 Tax=Gleimia hominis TaxID=595468 RepID=A0ABU3IBC4_9ACTO|nr:DeoR/GlpR family DNA-binding transcription regulator [Gleimia hominis]MDT3767538.1 DeoR/GlpR family DNA-binding transcription regulator [Gleimia hominis]WIK64954.1 DeoR/GlpR family DNA-binding transcription regulator [Gleimia hominis]
MNQHDRQMRIVNLVVERGSATVDELVDALGVSPATVRRDLHVLDNQQLLQRVRGGARAETGAEVDVPLRYRELREGDEKHAIARAIAQKLKPGEVIALNGGTTAAAIAAEIGRTFCNNQRVDATPLTVVTNAVNIANDLTMRPSIRVVVTGGVARSRSYELIGPLAEHALAQYGVDTLYLGVTAINFMARAFYTHNEGEAMTNAALVKIAQRVVVVADHTKMHQSAFAKICDFDAVDELITDRGADPESCRELEESGIKVTVV